MSVHFNLGAEDFHAKLESLKQQLGATSVTAIRSTELFAGLAKELTDHLIHDQQTHGDPRIILEIQQKELKTRIELLGNLRAMTYPEAPTSLKGASIYQEYYDSLKKFIVSMQAGKFVLQDGRVSFFPEGSENHEDTQHCNRCDFDGGNFCKRCAKPNPKKQKKAVYCTSCGQQKTTPICTSCGPQKTPGTCSACQEPIQPEHLDRPFCGSCGAQRLPPQDKRTDFRYEPLPRLPQDTGITSSLLQHKAALMSSLTKEQQEALRAREYLMLKYFQQVQPQAIDKPEQAFGLEGNFIVARERRHRQPEITTAEQFWQAMMNWFQIESFELPALSQSNLHAMAVFREWEVEGVRWIYILNYVEQLRIKRAGQMRSLADIDTTLHFNCINLPMMKHTAGDRSKKESSRQPDGDQEI